MLESLVEVSEPDEDHDDGDGGGGADGHEDVEDGLLEPVGGGQGDGVEAGHGHGGVAHEEAVDECGGLEERIVRVAAEVVRGVEDEREGEGHERKGEQVGAVEVEVGFDEASGPAHRTQAAQAAQADSAGGGSLSGGGGAEKTHGSTQSPLHSWSSRRPR